MEELRNLQQIYLSATENFSKYDGKDFVLPQIFKEQVKELNSSVITYYKYSAVIETRGGQNGGLKIYMPNQWFYIASFFTDLYLELQSFKDWALKIVSRERLKELNGQTLTPDESSKLKALPLNETSKEYLLRFITDYKWWYGAKTIDRGDFYVSPILNCACLVNASQSYIADLCAFLAERPELVKSIISQENHVEAETHLGRKIMGGSLQKIFYGAPGTGKSHTIKKETSEAEKMGNVFRTTFHPDSDYATFVGCYKPAMEPKEPLYSPAELISRLMEIKNLGGSYPCQKFGTKYWESLKDLSANDVKNIINACGFTDSMGTEVSKGVAIGEEFGNKLNQKQIVYRFTPQAFTNAYIRAWQTDEPVFLIIEEINRGNCAQIFGDLFQLLDRDDAGFSKYPIIPDTDLGNYIREQLQSIEAIPEDIKLCKEMKLPCNLYIWATMNTSDQSLFPIDSAFKRRWDWEYIPIENHPDEDYKIHVNGCVYDWWEFVQAINKEVFELTHSEDKQLGYFFVRPQNGIIDANMLVNKVYFYLWNDVFKDYELDSLKAFKKANNEAIAFKDFFEDGLNESLAEQIIINLEIGEEIQPAE